MKSRGDITHASIAAAMKDADSAVREFDNARAWFATTADDLAGPLATEVWVYDADLTRVLLVHHRWRRWVPPGGRVEAGETPRSAASRELLEETGLFAHLLDRPAAVAVRSYHPDWPATLGLSYVAVADASAPLSAESGQPAAWLTLATPWESAFPDDVERIRWHAAWLRETASRLLKPTVAVQDEQNLGVSST